MYYEGVDWGLRAMAVGVRGGVSTDAVVFHAGSASAGRRRAVAACFVNSVVVALSRLPMKYFRRHGMAVDAGVLRSFAYMAKNAGLLTAFRSLFRLVRVLPEVRCRRRELSWTKGGIDYLLKGMAE